MVWNWQRADWPNFIYNSTALEPFEQQFLRQSGEFIGACKHIGPDDRETLKIELISDEAVKTSEIEGRILNRDSVQSSLRQQLGLGAEPDHDGGVRWWRSERFKIENLPWVRCFSAVRSLAR
jgi:Fic family protein